MFFRHLVLPTRNTSPHRRFRQQTLIGLTFVALLLVGMQALRAVQAQRNNFTDINIKAQVDPTQPQVGPGVPQVGSNASRSAASISKAGSLLFFPKFTSDTTKPNEVNTLLTVTNTNPRDAVSLRVFFIYDCTADDLFITLVANQSRTFVASKEAPNTTGYAIVMAVNSQGLPTQFNWLAGHAALRDDSGHEAAYPAFAVAKRSAGAASFNSSGATADILFDNKDYDRLPKTVAIDNFQNQDPVSGPAVKTDIAIFSPQTDLGSTVSYGYNLNATLYDFAGASHSQDVKVSCGVAAGVGELWTTPPFDSVVSANRPGWGKISARGDNNSALPVIGLSLTDGATTAWHNARPMQTLEWLESFRLTIPIEAPGNPVADVVTHTLADVVSGGEGASESKAGSILLYPRFLTGANGTTQIFLTNTHPTQKTRVRVFFSGLSGTPEVRETILTLPAQQTVSLPADEISPEQRGWLLVMAIDSRALPQQFNYLIGSAQVAEAGGLKNSYNALAVARLKQDAAARNEDVKTASLSFDDDEYDRLPGTVAMPFVPSQGDSASWLGFVRPANSLLETPNTRTTANVMLYDELLANFGASVARSEIRLNQIRSSVLSPPITNTIQPGQHGWLKLLSATPVFTWTLSSRLAPFTTSGGSWRGGLNGSGQLLTLTTAENFVLNVPATNPNNHAPIAVADTIGLEVEARRASGTIVRLDGSGSSDEDQDDTLSYQWLDNDLPVSTARIADRRLALGNHTLKLIVSDASGVTSQPAEQNVNVVDTTPPQISGLPSAIAKVTDSVNGDVVTFPMPVAYDMVDGYVSVTLSQASGTVFRLGKTSVMVTAKDKAGNTARTSFDVTVSRGTPQPQTGGEAGSKAPVMENLNDQYVKRGTSRSITLQAVDEDGDPVMFSLQGAPSYAQLITGDPGSRTATLRIAPEAGDTAAATNVRVVASDGRGQSFSTLPFRIIISDVPNDDTGSGTSSNRPPIAVVAPLPAAIQADSKTGAEITLDGSLSRDPDGDPLIYSWYDGDVLLARGAVVTVNLAVGLHALKLTVFDGKDGITSTAAMVVEVLPRGLSVINSSPNLLDRGVTVTLTVTGTGFNSGSELRFGKEGINVTNYVSIEEDKIVATISIASNAIPGYRDVYVYNPTGQSARLRSGLFVNR